MAPFLPVRAISRSQNVRIGKQKVKQGTTTYVDLAAAVETATTNYTPLLAGSSLPFSPYKELQNHLSQGAIIVVGPLTQTNNPWVLVGSGGVTTATKATEPEVAVSTGGELYNRETGVYVSFLELGAAKKKFTNEAGKSRIDILSVELVGGKAAKYTAGTAAATGKQVAPAVPAESVLLATVTFLGKEGEPAEVAQVVKNITRA